MCSGRGDEQLRPTGFPIRKSPDQCLVADSPGLIAGSNVLLRLLVPRHPPCALINLATTIDARVQSHVSGERPEMTAHCGALVIRLARRSTQLVHPSGWKGGGGDGLVEHAVES